MKYNVLKQGEKSFGKLAAAELLRFLVLVMAMLAALYFLLVCVFRMRAVETQGYHHVLRNLGDLWPEFYSAAAVTLPIIGWAVVFLVLLSVVFASVIVAWPGAKFLKQLVLIASAVPAFTLPFLYYLLRPEAEFRGFVSEISNRQVGLLMAIGDLNLITLTTVLVEAMRRETGQPYLNLVRLLGKKTGWAVWPQILVSVLAALASRIPYLLGSTITLEILFEIHGLGILVIQAITDTPPRYSVILFVCGLGVIVTQFLSTLSHIAEYYFLPHHRPFRFYADNLDEADPNSKSEDGDASNDTGSGTVISTAALDGETSFDRWECMTVPELPVSVPVYSRWRQFRNVVRRPLYYLRGRPSNLVNALLASVILVIGVSVFVWAIGHVTPQVPGDSYAARQPGYPLGTDRIGDDVLSLVLSGLYQQIPAIVCCLLLILILGVTGAVYRPVADFLKTDVKRTQVPFLTIVANFACEFIESLPKLVVLLAALTLFESTSILIKLYLVMGFLFLPQMYRALRDELLPLSNAAYLETMQTMRVPMRSVLSHNILGNHVLHVVLLQGTLIVVSIIHVDALLGFASIAKPSGVFTLGSVLGKGASLYMLDKPVEQWYGFNSWILAGPLIAVWLLSVVLYTLADAFKVVSGGYSYYRY